MRYRTKKLIKNTLIILGIIFVFYLIFSPSTWSKLKDSVTESGESSVQSKTNLIALEINPYAPSCTFLEQSAVFIGMSRSEGLADECRNLCGNEKMEYGSYKCIVNRLQCYCERGKDNIFYSD